MSRPKLIRHSEISQKKKDVCVSRESTRAQEAALKQPAHQVVGTIRRFKRKEKASEATTSFNLIRTTYSAAIEYTGAPAQLRGLVMLFCAIGGFTCLYYGTVFWLRRMSRADHPFFIDQFMLPVCIIFISSGLGFLLWGFRLEFFRPIDELVIFDRKNRKVYRLFRQAQAGIKGLFERWPMRATEYPWNVVDAEHVATLSVNTTVAQRHHSLLFNVRRSNSDSTVVDNFAVFSGSLLGEASVAPAWEHIRRFMEDDGPHIPVNESPYREEIPTSLWQSLGAVGPFGPRYFSWWKDSPVMTTLMHLASPLMLPVCVVWGIFNWLSYKTAFQTEWPQEVLDAIGPPQTGLGHTETE